MTAVALPRVDCPKAQLACVLRAHADATLATGGTTLLLAFGAFLGAALLLGWRVDINKFSLYMLYRNRVVRAWFDTGLPLGSFSASSALLVPAGSPLSTAKRPICA